MIDTQETHEYNNVTTPYYPISAKSSFMGGEKQKKISKLISSKSGHDGLREVSVTRGSKYSDLTVKLLVFWETDLREEVVACETPSRLY